MSALFKALIFSCAVTGIFAFMSVRDDVAWFKNRTNIKDKFVSGVMNGIVDIECNDTINGKEVEGECLPKLECGKTGGKIGSLCSLMGVCCVRENTCGQSTSSKVSYFVPPGKFQSNCPLTINIFSKDVCQIRLDFIKFDIAKPTNRKSNEGDPGNTGYTSFQCHTDSFKVEKVGRNLGFPHLCGKNSGQHIYVPVDENQRQIVLRFNFNREPGVNQISPDWRIKIRQLECRRGGYDPFDIPSKLMSMYEKLKNKKRTKSDWYWIAPPNCLQYYPENTGVFESFNYDNGNGCYIGGLNYAICFRKTVDVCGAKYTAKDVFQMNYNEYNGEELQEDNKCRPSRKRASPTTSQDYIRIPGGKTSQQRFQDLFCNNDLTKIGDSSNNVVIVSANEPLYVGVHTDDFRAYYKEDTEDDHQEIGFKIQYELFSGHCDIPF